jgi:pyruvate/2-oxoglutarate dehydrogenase complex dihydrolipoamide dehydrogenase (E3) component
LTRIDPDAVAVLEERLREDGVTLRLGDAVGRVDQVGAGSVRLTLSDGGHVEAERLLVAVGRDPNVDGLALETVGITPGPRGIDVDATLAAAPNVWAIGDVTGVSLFTHVAKYQARIAASNVAGVRREADYRAIPSVVFTDPQVAQVGAIAGDGLVSAMWEVNRTSRSSSYERPKRTGFVRLFADARRKVVVGAVAVGPEAGEWLQQVTLAIRAEVPVDTLRDTIQPFPTFSEAISFAARDLPL